LTLLNMLIIIASFDVIACNVYFDIDTVTKSVCHH